MSPAILSLPAQAVLDDMAEKVGLAQAPLRGRKTDRAAAADMAADVELEKDAPPGFRVEAIVEAEIVHRPGRLPQRGHIALQIAFDAVRFEEFVAERIERFRSWVMMPPSLSERGRTTPSMIGFLPPSTGTVISKPGA